MSKTHDGWAVKHKNQNHPIPYSFGLTRTAVWNRWTGYPEYCTRTKRQRRIRRARKQGYRLVKVRLVEVVED